MLVSFLLALLCMSNGGNLCRGYFSYEKWRAQRDSNPRPSVPKTDALSAELWAREAKISVWNFKKQFATKHFR